MSITVYHKISLKTNTENIYQTLRILVISCIDNQSYFTTFSIKFADKKIKYIITGEVAQRGHHQMYKVHIVLQKHSLNK